MLTRIAFYLLALALRVLQTLLYLIGACWPSVEALVQYASELGDERRPPPPDRPGRVRVVERGGRRILLRGADEEVVLVGGNYVLKGAPWFPAPEDVREDCATVVANLAQGTWAVPGKTILPCWRLGCLWSGAQPSGPGGELDAAWVAQLRATVAIFEEFGIYCFLEVHQDAMCSTNGGEGIPHWVAEHFQARPEYDGASYLVSPSHPLEIALPSLLRPLWRRFVDVQTAPGEDDPWRAFSPEDETPGRDPSLFNIGNPSIRLNNYGDSWRGGVLFLSKQVQNVASRLYRSHAVAADRPVFDGYVLLLKELAAVWAEHANVVAIETLNEPPMGGLWDAFVGRPSRLLRMRSDLWRFQAAALEALEADGVPPACPVAVTDLGQALPGFSLATLGLALVDPIPWRVWRTLRRWARANKLLLSFHYYAPPTACSFSAASLRARLFGQVLSADLLGVPTFLSEFVEATPEEVADDIERSVELGTSAVAYWQYVSAKKARQMQVGGRTVTFHMQPDGWAAYAPPIAPPLPRPDGSLVRYAACDTLDDFRLYQQQVERGEIWGAAITQFGGAEVKHGVLYALTSYCRPNKTPLAAAADVLGHLAEERRRERRRATGTLRALFSRALLGGGDAAGGVGGGAEGEKPEKRD